MNDDANVVAAPESKDPRIGLESQVRGCRQRDEVVAAYGDQGRVGLDSEGAYATHEERQTHVDDIGYHKERDNRHSHDESHPIYIRENLSILVSGDIKRKRDHQSERKRLEQSHHSESLGERDIIGANFVANKDASGFSNAYAERVDH